MKSGNAKTGGTPRELARLYLTDETAWLVRMADLIKKRRHGELDYKNLRAYLLDMARRDQREVRSRLTTLLAHLLKWDHQPDMRSRSWELTIKVQRHELIDLCESQTLKNHAQEILPAAYTRACEQAAAETGLPEGRFPHESPYTLEDLLTGK